MVALTPRCAAELGYTLSEEDKMRSYIEVSGRKGFGVKADDLLDQLIASAKSEVDSRHPQLLDDERLTIATQIAIGAMRDSLLKFTKQSVIAFDFKEALSFEGETGPYAQYAVVRAASIFKKAGLDPDSSLKKSPPCICGRFRAIPDGRIRRRNLGTLAIGGENGLHRRPMHHHYRTGLPCEARLSTGAAFQYLLSPPSHPERAG